MNNAKKEQQKIYNAHVRKIRDFLGGSLQSSILQYRQDLVESLSASENQKRDFENDVKYYFINYLQNEYNFDHYVRSKVDRELVSDIITNYCILIRKDDWKEIHQYLIKDYIFAINHVKYVIKNNWSIYEDLLSQNMTLRRINLYSNVVKQLPEVLHNFMVANAIKGSKQATKYISKAK
jgi:hypothetical protein